MRGRVERAAEAAAALESSERVMRRRHPPPLPRMERTDGGRRYEENGPSGPSTAIEEEAAQA